MHTNERCLQHRYADAILGFEYEHLIVGNLLCKIHLRKVALPFISAGLGTPWQGTFLVDSHAVYLVAQVIAITDGEPAGEPVSTTSNVIRNAKNLVSSSQYGPGAIAFQFAQVRALTQTWVPPIFLQRPVFCLNTQMCKSCRYIFLQVGKRHEGQSACAIQCGII